MATILELAREVRHHIVSHSTGRLDITYSDRKASVDFSGGTIVSSKESFVPCFREAPEDFEFRQMEVPPPDEHQSGAALLIEAMESIAPDTLDRIWEPYHDWMVALPQDPDIHSTRVADHVRKGAGRLRRLMRLVVSGVATLEPPPPRSIHEEMADIKAAIGRGDYWQVLGVTRSASPGEVKKAYRRLVRQFHPDRWHAVDDTDLKRRAEDAFRDVQRAHEEVLASLARVLPQPEAAPEAETAPPEPAEPAVETGPIEPPRPAAHAASSYQAASRPPESAPSSLFRRIFDRMFRAA